MTTEYDDTTTAEQPHDPQGLVDALVIADRQMGRITNRKALDLVARGLEPTGVVLLDPSTGMRAVCEMARVCWYTGAEWADIFHRRIPRPEPLADVLERAQEFERAGMRLQLKR